MATKPYFLSALLILGSVFSVGCLATRGYVRSSVQPVSSKLDQVSTQTNQQGAQLKQTSDKLDQTSQQVQHDETVLSATKETADAADSRSTEALNGTRQNAQQLSDLNNTVANLDAYKVSDQAVVLFGFNRSNLTSDAKAKLDTLASGIQSQSRFFITVEGYTDQTGPASYNDILSRKRADSVIRYLVAEHNIPIYRIHTIGLGEENLVNGGRTLQDRKESRRVHVSVYVAPPLPTPKSSSATQ